jgi:hypothetical protein
MKINRKKKLFAAVIFVLVVSISQSKAQVSLFDKIKEEKIINNTNYSQELDYKDQEFNDLSLFNPLIVSYYMNCPSRVYNTMTPKHQGLEYYSVIWADNIGLNTQQNVMYELKYFNNLGDTVVFIDTITQSLIYESFDSSCISTPFIPEHIIADYSVAVRIMSDSVDDNPMNNMDTLFFSITDSTYAHDFGIPSIAIGPNYYIGGMDEDMIGNKFIYLMMIQLLQFQFLFMKKQLQGC